MENRKPITPAFRPIHDADVTTWELPEGAIARLGRGKVSDIAFSPDGRYIAVATRIGLWWYELATMLPVALWETERGVVSAVSFSDNGRWLATGKFDGAIKVWSTQTHRCIIKTEAHEQSMGIDELTFSPDGQYLCFIWLSLCTCLHLVYKNRCTCQEFHH